MSKSKNSGLSRRNFLGMSALGLTGLTILPSYVIGGTRVAPSDRVVLGFVGLGRQALSDFRGFSSVPGVEVAACCDVHQLKNQRFKQRVAEWQESRDVNPRCDIYEAYEELLERTDIDAIECATPDHWHALVTINACQAGKDVYVQKPLSYTIQEAIETEKAALRTNRVVQIGSQQRSDERFQKAIELVRAGGIGHIDKVYAKVGDPPTPLDLPEQKVPAYLNWAKWLGPLNDSRIHYNSDLCPEISLDPVQNETLWGAWRWYLETGNGYTADWGAHMFDIAQAAIGMDGSGPSEIIPKGYQGTEHMTFKYQTGVVMTEQAYLEDNPTAQGIKFIGDNGWIEVSRSHIACSDMSLIPEGMEGSRPMTREQREAMMAERAQQPQQQQPQQRQATTAYEISSPHMQNFIDCVRSRQKPIATVEYGTSTAITCCLGNIANELQRPVKWDPAVRMFIDDEEATNHRLNQYEYHGGYKLV